MIPYKDSNGFVLLGFIRLDLLLFLYQKAYSFNISKNSMAEEKQILSKLMEMSQSGNKDSYRELLHKISIILSKYLSTRIVSYDDREDVLQEILISIHNARHTYIPSRPFYPWMYAIAKNTLIKYYKKIHKQSLYQMEAEISSLISPEKNDSNEIDSTKEILKLIEELPGKQKEIIQLLKIGGLSIKDVAAKLNLSEANVKVIAHRGYQTLRKRVRYED